MYSIESIIPERAALSLSEVSRDVGGTSAALKGMA